MRLWFLRILFICLPIVSMITLYGFLGDDLDHSWYQIQAKFNQGITWNINEIPLGNVQISYDCFWAILDPSPPYDGILAFSAPPPIYVVFNQTPPPTYTVNRATVDKLYIKLISYYKNYMTIWPNPLLPYDGTLTVWANHLPPPHLHLPL